MSYIGNKPANKAVTASDLEDGIITNAKLAQDIISAETELAEAPASTDEFLISDGGTLKRLDASYIGGANTPAFNVKTSSGQSISNGTATQIVYGTEVFDTDSAFASNTFTVPSGKAGKYFLFAQSGRQGWDSDRFMLQMQKTPSGGSTVDIGVGESHDGEGYHTTGVWAVADLAVGDAIKIMIYHDSGSTRTLSTDDRTVFQGFKLI